MPKEQTLQELVDEKLTLLIVENNNMKKSLIKLERVIARIAHQTGTQNILKLYGIDKYIPGREDMKKWKN